MLVHHLQVNSQIILSVISRKKYWFFFQSFTDLANKPQIVDLLVEEGQRLKVVYGSNSGFHAIDVDTTSLYDLYIPSHVSYQTALISLYMSIFLKVYQIFSFIITCKSYLAKNDWSLSLAALCHMSVIKIILFCITWLYPIWTLIRTCTFYVADFLPSSMNPLNQF